MRNIAMVGWKILPKGVQDVVASTVDAIQGNTVPEAPMADPFKKIRLFICPANYAGQGYRWARAVEANPDISAKNMVYAEINPFGYSVDYPVRWRTVTHSRKWQKNQLASLTSNFTHLLVEAEFPPLGGMFDGNIRKQISLLRSRGLAVAMVCHGSDIRLPSRHKELEQWSPFGNDDWVPVARLEKVMLKNRKLLDDLSLPTFVSTPGLLLDVPYSSLLPVVISPDKWLSTSPVLERLRPRVAHIPSNPLVKGTAEINAAMEELQKAGLIEYIQITGQSNDDMPRIIGECDVVLDQFRLGDYGVAACEAMAAGRLVISHVSEQVRRVVQSEWNVELPIVEANVDNIGEVLRGVLADRARYKEVASRGPAYVDRVHDGRMSRKALEEQFLYASGPDDQVGEYK